jgi:transposase
MPGKFDPEARARAVRMVHEQAPECGSVTRACEVVGRRRGIGKETLRGWVPRAQVDAGQREGATSEELEQVRALKARVRRLEEDNAILKAATTFFAGELDPRSR